MLLLNYHPYYKVEESCPGVQLINDLNHLSKS